MSSCMDSGRHGLSGPSWIILEVSLYAWERKIVGVEEAITANSNISLYNYSQETPPSSPILGSAHPNQGGGFPESQKISPGFLTKSDLKIWPARQIKGGFPVSHLGRGWFPVYILWTDASPMKHHFLGLDWAHQLGACILAATCLYLGLQNLVRSANSYFHSTKSRWLQF